MFEDIERNLDRSTARGMTTVLAAPEAGPTSKRETWEIATGDEPHVDFMTNDLAELLVALIAKSTLSNSLDPRRRQRQRRFRLRRGAFLLRLARAPVEALHLIGESGRRLRVRERRLHTFSASWPGLSRPSTPGRCANAAGDWRNWDGVIPGARPGMTPGECAPCSSC